MSIGDVFTKAFELWKRDVLWLILAALVVGLIIGVIAAIVFAIIFGVALGGVGLGYSASSSTFNGVGAGMIVLAVIGYVVGLFAIMVLAMTFYGGLFEMVIGAARENRPVVFSDLFSGFKKFGSYAMFALAISGIVIGLSLLNIIPVLGTLAMIAILLWIEVLWLYVLPLIADQGLTFGEAQTRSRAMVKDVGWWKTFGMLILLLVAIWAVAIIIAIISSLLSKASSSVGGVIGGLLFIVFEVIVGPYVICYISTMYLGSGGVMEPALGGAGGYAVPHAPPAPPQAPVMPAAPAAPVTSATAAVPPASATPPAPAEAAVPDAAAEATTESGEAIEAGADEATDAAQTAVPEPPVMPPEAPSAPANPPPPPQLM